MKLKELLTDLRVYAAIAVLLGGVFVSMDIPNRVKRNEEDIDKWKEVTIEQKAILQETKNNQKLLIEILQDD